MELILAILVAGPLGWFSRDRRRALIVYLALAAAVFPIQCAVVSRNGDLDAAYWPVNVVILGGGIALNRLAARLRTRRAVLAVQP